jgi:hypothetical protein
VCVCVCGVCVCVCVCGLCVCVCVWGGGIGLLGHFDAMNEPTVNEIKVLVKQNVAAKFLYVSRINEL